MAFIKTISTNQSDQELVALYKSSQDLTVLANLYQRYMDLVYGVCLKYFQHAEEAKDAVITIYEELIPKLKKHDVVSFKPWLYRTVINHCLMKLRKEKNNPHFIDTSVVHLAENEHLDTVLQKEANLKLMEDCLEKLIQEQRAAVELFYLQGKCYKEIAEITNIDQGKTRSHIQNGKRNLKICMEKQVDFN